MSSDALYIAARAAAQHGSAPYSEFRVGAAVEAVDGRLFRGCNVESASYGLSICAERVAVFNSISAGARPIALAVSCLDGDPAQPESLMPCGACRQVMLDQMGPDAPVYVDRVGAFTVAELIPRGFRLP
jgi:cytidine deaminase